MLFHVKVTHSEDNCPMYRHELMPDMLKAMIDSDDHSAEDGTFDPPSSTRPPTPSTPWSRPTAS
jgi:hypothetical protein